MSRQFYPEIIRTKALFFYTHRIIPAATENTEVTNVRLLRKERIKGLAMELKDFMEVVVFDVRAIKFGI